MITNKLLFLVLWIVVGLVSTIAVWIFDMRGKEFKEDYFDEKCIIYSIVSIALGLITPFIIYCIATSEKNILQD